MLFFDEGDVERNVCGAAENDDLGAVAGFVKIEAEGKKEEECWWASRRR